MDPAAAARFAAGAGVDPGALRAGAVAVAGLAALAWAVRTIDGLYRHWRAGETDIPSLLFGMGRVAVVALLVLYFLQ